MDVAATPEELPSPPLEAGPVRIAEVELGFPRLAYAAIAYLSLKANTTFRLTTALPSETELFSKQEFMDSSNATATHCVLLLHCARQLWMLITPFKSCKPEPSKFKPQFITNDASEPMQAPAGVYNVLFEDGHDIEFGVAVTHAEEAVVEGASPALEEPAVSP